MVPIEGIIMSKKFSINAGRIKYLLIISAVTIYMMGSFSLAAETRKDYLKREILEANSGIYDQDTRDYKFSQMSSSAFAFFRATAHLYYSDLNSGVINVPSYWSSTPDIRTWIQGDMHTQNVGFFDNDRGEIVFDLNDFDESFVAPFYFDLIRLGVSIHLMKDDVNFNLSRSEAYDLHKDFLSEYQNTLDDVNGNSLENSIYLDRSELGGFTRDELDDVEGDRNDRYQLDKWTVIVGGTRRFDLTNPELEALSSGDYEISTYWHTYTNDVAGNFNSGYFNVKDRAVRLYSGLGSLGVRKYYVLVEGATTSNNDDVILEVKEQTRPTMLDTALSYMQSSYNSWFGSNHSARNVSATKAMLNRVDDHLGDLTTYYRSYMVRRISPYKKGLEGSDFDSENDLDNFLKYTARALAYAHARSDRDYDSYYVGYNFENGALDAIDEWPSAKTTMANLADDYADQVFTDYQLFVQLVQEGKIY